MNLPILFVLAFAGLVSIFLWVIILIVLAVIKLFRNVGKNRNPSANPLHNPDNNPQSMKSRMKEKSFSRQSAAEQSSVIGHDDTAISQNDPQSEPSVETTDENKSDSNAIKLNSREIIKKAIIYHEIFDIKF